jgi:putative restriction endonuclease
VAEKRVWSFLTIDGIRQYGGNAGYLDDPSSIYRYDSDVANHLQVSAGDVAVIRSRTEVLGVAEIEQVVEGTGNKERLRCPECGATNIKERATKQPKWACKFGHQFDVPKVEVSGVTTYAAFYGATFIPMQGKLNLEEVHSAVIRPSDQMSIKQLDLAKIELALRDIEGGNAIVRRFASTLEVGEREPDSEDDLASIIDIRRRVLREISLRRGQAAFRKRLIRRYGEICQISGCAFSGLVEAAHIDPYSRSQDNGLANGLLLRSDLHTLFDLGLLGISPESLTVHLAPVLHEAGYSVSGGWVPRFSYVGSGGMRTV